MFKTSQLQPSPAVADWKIPRVLPLDDALPCGSGSGNRTRVSGVVGTPSLADDGHPTNLVAVGCGPNRSAIRLAVTDS